MKRLEIPATSRTPEIILDSKTKTFTITGKFFPENIKDFLVPVTNWLEEYKKEAAKEIELFCNIDYLSSSSIIYLKQIFMKISEIQDLGTKVTVVWNFDEDDDDIKKTGEFYMKNLKLHFVFNINQ